MKKVTGGNEPDEKMCLYCRTSGGDECWYRKHPSGDPLEECLAIYGGGPVYMVSASWGICDEWCFMG